MSRVTYSFTHFDPDLRKFANILNATQCKIIVSVILAFLMTGCDDSYDRNAKNTTMNDLNLITDDTKKALQAIQNTSILFGHQSVGNDIISGMQSLSEETGIQLKIKKISIEPISGGNVFAHLIIGKNKDPKSKIDAFANQIRKLDKLEPKIAYMKFCYIDFLTNTNVEDVFQYYQQTIKKLKKEKPNTKFIHLTVPLTSKSYSLKSIIKEIIGRPSWNDDASNIKRENFNKLVRQTFSNEYIFDIARIESTKQDGSRESFIKNGKTYYRLVPDYTTDGGHLNSFGQQIVAKEMVEYLADIMNKSNSNINK